MMIVLDLPTELLSRILSYLPAADLCAAQQTCHQINCIITDSVLFQYILRAHRNGVEYLLPSDCSFYDRLELLKSYEKSWNTLQLNKSDDFPISIEAPTDADRYTLQDGYLIYETGAPRSYGYIDLCSAIGNKKVSWTLIPIIEHPNMCHAELTFAVDQDLVISLSRANDRSSRTLSMFAFEFTTGAPHPLSPMHTIPLRIEDSPIGMEVLGDYILVSAGIFPISLYIASWKTGVLTHLRTVKDRLMSRKAYRPLVIDPDNNLVVLPRSNINSLEICKLVTTSRMPRLQTLYFLGLPLAPLRSCAITAEENEWVPTSKHQVHSQSSRQRLAPFRSSAIRTVFFSLQHSSYGMIVSVAALLSATRSNRVSESTVPWTRWGPVATHIFPLKRRDTLARPAGPFWMMNKSPLVIRDYDPPHKRRVQLTAENVSSLETGPSVLPSKTSGEQWVGGNVETYLPYRDVVSIDDRHLLVDCTKALMDREWLVGIRSEGVAEVIVHHIG